jgi:hypothetical protein
MTIDLFHSSFVNIEQQSYRLYEAVVRIKGKQEQYFNDSILKIEKGDL